MALHLLFEFDLSFMMSTYMFDSIGSKFRRSKLCIVTDK